MRIILIFFFFSISSLTASAQWWKINLAATTQWLKLKKPPPPRPEPLEGPLISYPTQFITDTRPPQPRIAAHTYLPSDFTLEAAEDDVMKTAQHNMRFRIYDVASYNFSELAQLYVKQSRLSEAKWYFLQSTFLSRQQNNNKLTMSNLIKLAEVKSEIGDFALARQDMLDARDIASSHGWLIDVIEIEKKLTLMQHTRFAATLHGDMRYADVADEN